MSVYVEYGGVLRANPHAADYNNIRMKRHDQTRDSVALDWFENTVVGTHTITSITVDGVAYAIAGTPQVQDHATWKPLVEAILGSGDPQEMSIVTRATYTGGKLSFEHQGAKTISKITTNNGDLNLSRETNKSQHADYKATVSGTLGGLSNGAASQALANDPYNWTGNAGTDASTAGQLKTDIEAALGALSVSYVSVAVTVNNVAQGFDVVIHRKHDNTYLYFGSNKIEDFNHQIEWDSGALAV